jgi:predicted MPP superfamily phosphohydrolase
MGAGVVGNGMNDSDFKRRDFLALGGLGGVVFASALVGCGRAGASTGARMATSSSLVKPATPSDFFFLQLTDTHWGFEGAPNPEAAVCLKQTVQAINAVETQPDFIVFTGDLTHKTDDAKQRRERMAEFREIVGALRTKKLIFLPGEHDAAADAGEAYHENFGELRQSFEHQGVHFVALDNASAPGGALGDAQLAWLTSEVERVPAEAALVVLAHRPLFELYPEWEWATSDGARALEILSRHQNTSVFYGHIHQEHHHTTGNITHHSARSLIFPLPAAGAAPKRVPLTWDPASPDHGLGHRSIRIGESRPSITEIPFVDATPAAPAAHACNGPAPSYTADVQPVLEKRCFSCHTGDGSAASDFDFSHLEGVHAARRDIAKQITAHAMPPRAPLAASESDLLLRWIACSTG